MKIELHIDDAALNELSGDAKLKAVMENISFFAQAAHEVRISGEFGVLTEVRT